MVFRISFSTAVFALAVSLSPVAQANDTLDAMIGKTFVLTYEDGSVVRSYYKEDGTLTTDGGLSATWTMEGDTLCIEVDQKEVGCAELPSGKRAGDSWEWRDISGRSVTASIE